MPYVEHHYGCFLIRGRAFGKEGMLVQTDWDYPYAAQQLGWSLRRVQPGKDGARFLARSPKRGSGCNHDQTDGTVNCPDCGCTSSDFITAAGDFLSSLC